MMYKQFFFKKASSLKKTVRESIKRIELVVNKGKQYYCPFCGYESKKLAKIGANFPVIKEKKIVGGGRRLGGCLNCGSTDRERLIYIYLKEKLNLFTEINRNVFVLHIAPEKRISKLFFNERFPNYVCGDKHEERYSYPEYVKHLDIRDLPFENEYFDLIICNHVLEHIPNDFEAMSELYRVLKKGGQAILQVPISLELEATFEDKNITSPKERERVFGQSDHVRIYGQDYPSRLSECKFIVEKVNFSDEVINYGLNKDEVIFVAHKY